MLVRLLLIAVATATVYYVYNIYQSFRHNLKAAQKSGLPYIISPIYWLSPSWLLAQSFVTPWLAYLPPRYTAWVDHILNESSWDNRYDIFGRMGHDTYIVVAPGGNTFWTCDADVVSQITNRRSDFPKPGFLYAGLNIYGPNVVSAEGQAWRHHRKATGPPFSEANNRLVWKETIDNAESMLRVWLGPDHKGTRAISRIGDDTMRLSLNVISTAGFGRKGEWPTAEARAASKDTGDYIQNDKNDIDAGHLLGWTYAMHALLEGIIFFFVLPVWIVPWLPFNAAKKAWTAYTEWKAYMQEAISKSREGKKAIKAGDDRADILDTLIKAQTSSSGQSSLTQEEVMGNMFVLIFAGHETTANTIHFAMLFLALHMDSQKRFHMDLDQIFQGRPAEEWDYDKDLPLLFGGMAGAVLSETLRLVPPALSIFKSTLGVGEQAIKIGGKDHILPADMFVMLHSAAIHRNPRFWPTQKPQLPGGHTVHPISNIDNDLEEFRPERWLLQDSAAHANQEELSSESARLGDVDMDTSTTISERLYKPYRGAYIPFSEGYRACLGRRFAQIEMMAAIAVLYQDHTIELDVSKYASDNELRNMTVDERAEVWQKAAEDARNLFLTGMVNKITLQMRKGHVPVRIRKRGQEMFPTDVDEIWKRNNANKCSPLGTPDWSAWRR